MANSSFGLEEAYDVFSLSAKRMFGGEGRGEVGLNSQQENIRLMASRSRMFIVLCHFAPVFEAVERFVPIFLAIWPE